ncbi:MAG: YicC/YloC family endoribonuclease [Prevotella sp.]|nr:YicC family protein [Prevotella sp.]MDY2805208.1 YicC/YloC family endoribonuclease [Prevotella sp.]
MILSMTGYGKAVATFNEKKISVEIKSLNSKALDLSTRVAPLYREKEMEIRQMIQQKVIRGKVDFAIWIEKDVATEAAPINVALIENYYNQLQNVAKRLGLSCQEVNGGNIASDWMKVLMRMPDVMSRQEIEELSDEEWTVVRQAIDDALCALVDFRKQEGAALEKKFNEKIDNIEALMLSIEPYEKARVEKIRARIIDGLKAIPEIEYDKNRLEQELIYYIEKLDISEEKQRLANHLNYFRETMAEVEGGQGKKLGFIAQEMGREINTTGSKSNQAEMQNIVVKMKDELEQIKEQVLNAL